MTTKPTYRELLEESLPHPSDPLYQMNLEYALSAVERGGLIADITEEYVPAGGNKVLDLGCGEGGVAIAFALRGALATALDLSQDRIERMRVRANELGTDVRGVAANALQTGLPSDEFDIIVCNDFFEHVDKPPELAKEINRLLKDGGYAYISVQNRLSIFGFISDPHLRLFGLTSMPRSLAKFYAVKVRRRSDSYSIFVVPTRSYLRKIFKSAGMDITPIGSSKIRDLISNPESMDASLKKLVLTLLKRMRLSWTARLVLDSWLNQFFLGALTYIGTKETGENSARSK